MITKNSDNNKFCFIVKSRFNWRLLLQIFCITAVIYLIETLDYFFVATWAGSMFNNISSGYTLNLQLPFDKIVPWQTWWLPYYMLWPYTWFVILPLVIYFAAGKKAFYQYSLNSLIVYTVSIVLYFCIPTTCSPSTFMCDLGKTNADYISGGIINNDVMWGSMLSVNNGHYHLLQQGDLFYKTVHDLASSPMNIWGSAPSFHNYWASLLIFFAFKKNTKWFFRYPMLVCGLGISLSTLGLHQHNLADIVITYGLAFGCFAYVVKKDNYFEKFVNRIFNIKE